MRKFLLSVVLGAALLAPAVAFAQNGRPAEPRWGIRPEQSAPVRFDMGRWLAERLRDVLEPAPAPAPTTSPVPAPKPNPTTDMVCPDRWHCPVG